MDVVWCVSCIVTRLRALLLWIESWDSQITSKKRFFYTTGIIILPTQTTHYEGEIPRIFRSALIDFPQSLDNFMIPKQPQNYSLSWESPQEIRSYWGTINHWFPLIRPSKGLISWGGWHWGGREFLHEMIRLKTPGKPHKRLLFFFRSPTIYTCVYIYFFFQHINTNHTSKSHPWKGGPRGCDMNLRLEATPLVKYSCCGIETDNVYLKTNINDHEMQCQYPGTMNLARSYLGKRGTSLSRGFFKQITWRQHRVDSLISLSTIK